jgi:hypothetical protein
MLQTENRALTNWRNNVSMDVILGSLLGQSLSESNQGEFSSGVICLTKVSEKTGSRSSIDNAAELLFPEIRPCGSRTLV